MEEAHIRLPKDHLRPLTGLRFIAAALIVLHHSQGEFGIPAGYMHPWRLDNGVSFFFVLSGFILTYVYPQLQTRRDIAAFMLARIARVWPLHIVCLAAVYIILNWSHSETISIEFTIFISNILLIQAWIPDFRYIFSYNSVSWSVSAEIFFYILFPYLIFKFKITWFWKIIMSLCILIAMFIIVDQSGLGGYRGMEPGLTVPALIYIHPVSRIFEFILGMVTCILWKQYWPAVSQGIAGLIESAAIILLLWNASQVTSWANLSRDIGGPGLENWLIHSGTCFGAAILIASFASGSGPISRFMGSAPMLLLGEISFAMYMTHQLLLNSLRSRSNWLFSMPNGIAFGIYVIVLLIISLLSWRYIEIPAKNIIVRWGSRIIHGGRLGKELPLK